MRQSDRPSFANHDNAITPMAVAQAANIAKGAVCHHSNSKEGSNEELFLHVVARSLHIIQELLRQAVARTVNEAPEWLMHLTPTCLAKPLEYQHFIQRLRRDADRYVGSGRPLFSNLPG